MNQIGMKQVGMKTHTLRKTVLWLGLGLLLGGVFLSYFRPGLVVALGGQLLALCGW